MIGFYYKRQSIIKSYFCKEVLIRENYLLENLQLYLTIQKGEIRNEE